MTTPVADVEEAPSPLHVAAAVEHAPDLHAKPPAQSASPAQLDLQVAASAQAKLFGQGVADAHAPAPSHRAIAPSLHPMPQTVVDTGYVQSKSFEPSQ